MAAYHEPSYQHGFEEERFEQTVSQNFQCIICTNVLRDPVMCRGNQHLFCRACITRHLGNFQTCPTCMQELCVETLTEAPRAVKNFLSELKIRCEFHDRGCLALVELGNLENHVKLCGFAPVACSNEGCELVVNQRDLIHHESTVCKQRRVKCHSCIELRQEMDTVKSTLEAMNKKLDVIQDKLQHQRESKAKSKVVVAGGWNEDSGELNSVELFDVLKQTWSYLQPMKESRASGSAFVYDNQIIVSGGWIKSNQLLRTDSIEALQNANHVSPLSTWKNFPAKLSGKLSRFSTVVYNDSLIVVGGDDGSSNVDYSKNISEISLVRPYAIKLLTKMPRNLCWHSVEIFGDKIVIVGGHTTHSISSVLMYDIKQNKCGELVPLPQPVRRMATVKWGDNVIVIGGEKKNFQAINTVMIYNVKTQQCHWLPPMIHKRSGCTAAVVDDTIIVMGGEDEKRTILNSVERFSFAKYTWEELPSMREARKGSTSVAC